MAEAHEFTTERANRLSSYVLSSQGVSKVSRYRRRLVPWEKIQTLWILENSFLLFYSDTGFWVIPRDQIPEEAHTFLMKMVHEIGVRTKSLG